MTAAIRSFIAFFLCCSSIVAEENSFRFVAIIMDDLGNDGHIGSEVIALPYDLTYSFLPHTKYAKKLIARANQNRKEIMLHLPMQPISNKEMGKGGLKSNMHQAQFLEILRNNIQAVPGAIGINNHMGSLLTQDHIKMTWLMQELKENKSLYFVDSRTHGGSIAAVRARAFNIPTATRDIFLDHVVEEEEIDSQFHHLLSRINSVGYALAIGHPHEHTLKALKKWLPRLQAEGIEIVTVSQYIALENMRNLMWQASLSRSHKVVKN